MFRMVMALPLPLLAVGLLALSCGSNGENNATREARATEPDEGATPASACQYELGDDSGSTTMAEEFPPGLYPAAVADTGTSLTVSLVDPRDSETSITLTVPECKREEALRVIDARQEADREQAEAGIPFEDRTYP